MEFDLVAWHGLLVDESGAPRRHADVVEKPRMRARADFFRLPGWCRTQARCCRHAGSITDPLAIHPASWRSYRVARKGPPGR
jgi:hypothetical protein